jgi:hypothetical protein
MYRILCLTNNVIHKQHILQLAKSQQTTTIVPTKMSSLAQHKCITEKIAQTVLTNFAKLSRRKTVHFIIPPVSTNFAIFAAQSRSLAGSILSGNFALYFTDVFF